MSRRQSGCSSVDEASVPVILLLSALRDDARPAAAADPVSEAEMRARHRRAGQRRLRRPHGGHAGRRQGRRLYRRAVPGRRCSTPCRAAISRRSRSIASDKIRCRRTRSSCRRASGLLRRAYEPARPFTAYNVVGRVPGRAPDGRVVLVMAHYDHLGMCEPEGVADRICNGAVDNASGMAAVIAVAERVAKLQLDRDVWFVATCGEEWGLLGAKAFADNPPVALETHHRRLQPRHDRHRRQRRARGDRRRQGHRLETAGPRCRRQPWDGLGRR